MKEVSQGTSEKKARLSGWLHLPPVTVNWGMNGTW